MRLLDMLNTGSKGKYLNSMIVRNLSSLLISYYTLDNIYYLYLIPILRMK